MSSKNKQSGSSQPSITAYYKVEGLAVVRLKKECPRCGKGVFMGDHDDRYACGKCGYTQWKKKG